MLYLKYIYLYFFTGLFFFCSLDKHIYISFYSKVKSIYFKTFYRIKILIKFLEPVFEKNQLTIF